MECILTCQKFSLHSLESEREANLTAGRALELALQYNFVTELTSLIVVGDDNFTLGDGQDENGALEDLASVFGFSVPVGAAGPVAPSAPSAPGPGGINNIILQHRKSGY